MIYTITTLKTIYGYRNPVHTYELGCRTVGYYTSLRVAKEEVERNSMDIYEEGYYPFCVVEEVQPGIYFGIGYGEHWYQWIDGGYKPIDKPEELKHTIGFSMG